RWQPAGGMSDQVLAPKRLQAAHRSGMVGITSQGGEIPRHCKVSLPQGRTHLPELVADIRVDRVLGGLSVESGHFRDEGIELPRPAQVAHRLGGPSQPAVGQPTLVKGLGMERIGGEYAIEAVKS